MDDEILIEFVRKNKVLYDSIVLSDQRVNPKSPSSFTLSNFFVFIKE